MGVPKFFRWMSERYPAISQLIAEQHIPEFDCLYLDMNGIIHNCTHKDSDSPTFRLTEEKMFIAIFNYIEHLFGKIKPKKLFFMAIDGVAPRAKMNQQRARRFRTALDAELSRNKAIREGLEMPKEDPFDSNCITPGTEFMARLTRHLKYFINKKVSEDSDWQGVEIVLSGHEVPGEGEHKIMEYIRQTKSQPGYDPNRRHCLYGLDADLIMLGLLSHDPHFCLLREEVTFGRQSQKKSKELEHQNFYLLHLCLLREFLELEFQELREPGALSFPFDLERVIDDFILMAFFVGNDFLPNLPYLHINEGALALMYGVYKTVLRKMDGYINEGGLINFKRLETLLDELSHVEYRFFESENADASWFKGKRMEKEDVMDRTKRRGQLIVSSEQKAIFRKIRTFVSSGSSSDGQYDLPAALPARDRKFVEDLADSLHLRWKTVENSEGERHLQLSFPPRALAGDDENESEEEDEEAQAALLRVIKQYENAKVVDISAEEAQASMEKKYEEKFTSWKNKHYQDKFEWSMDNEIEMKKLTENYVQGLQWVLFYYYRGVASWPWFYGYHYAPMISDVKKGLGADVNFKLGQPFRPYQQLMGVLPDRSKKIVPTTYWELMSSPESPIIDFYPRDFELDMNGKKQEWEAVVKIPFIDESRLLSAMASKEAGLSDDERARNEFGVSLKFTFDPKLDFRYPSSLPGIFPDIEHTRCVENIFELPTMDGLEVYVGLMPGALLGSQALAGFPSLKPLSFNGALGFHGVSVFQQESRNESMIVTLADTDSTCTLANAQAKLGKALFVSYPFLQEARVVKVSDELFDYVLPTQGPSSAPIQVPHGPREIEMWRTKASKIEKTYSKRFGMVIGAVESLVHVEMLQGLKKEDSGATVKEYGFIEGIDEEYATQTLVDEVHNEDPRFIEKAALPLEEEFPINTKAFFLGDFAYGRPLQIISHSGETLGVWVSALKGKEPEFGHDVVRQVEKLTPYTPSYAVARLLNLNPLVLSKLTSAFTVQSSGLKLNLGLNLKFEARKLKVLGYSRRSQSGWEFSQKAIDLVSQYMIKFPEFIAGVMRNPKGDMFEDSDFYPKEEAAAKMKEIGQWLKDIESKSFAKVPLDAMQLDSNAVKMIEQAADKNLQNGPQAEAQRMDNVPRHALLKPSDADIRLGQQSFALGDRVVYVAETGRVPIAQRGTVIGITRTIRVIWLDVVFDTTFMSGTSLDDRCSEFRGSTVPHTAVLNLTDRQAVAMSKAGAAHSHSQSSNGNMQQRGYGAPSHIGGQGRLVPASTPPPLRGSYRGAFGGQNGSTGRGSYDLPIRGGSRGGTGMMRNGANAAGASSNGQPRGGSAQRGGRAWHGGHQGRGGAPNRNGFTIVDTADPTAGVLQNNPSFRPQNYSAVPPPASLDATRGERGRGRGRGGRGGRNGRGGRSG